MYLLISPAKKLNESPARPPLDLTTPALLPQAEELAQVLKKQSADDLAELMGISPKLAALNEERYQKFTTPFTADNASAALTTFQGDVYASMQISTYGVDQFNFAQQHLGILSGLYGLLRPLDLMQPYRLEMGTTLAGSWGKSLYDFWGGKITQQIAANAEGKPVLNLASQEYAKAVDFSAFNQSLSIDFKQAKEGRLKTIGIYAKKARGMFADYVITHEINEIELLKHFNTDGYRYSDDLSDSKTLTFVKVID